MENSTNGPVMFFAALANIGMTPLSSDQYIIDKTGIRKIFSRQNSENAVDVAVFRNSTYSFLISLHDPPAVDYCTCTLC